MWKNTRLALWGHSRRPKLMKSVKLEQICQLLNLKTSNSDKKRRSSRKRTVLPKPFPRRTLNWKRSLILRHRLTQWLSSKNRWPSMNSKKKKLRREFWNQIWVYKIRKIRKMMKCVRWVKTLAYKLKNRKAIKALWMWVILRPIFKVTIFVMKTPVKSQNKAWHTIKIKGMEASRDWWTI